MIRKILLCIIIFLLITTVLLSGCYRGDSTNTFPGQKKDDIVFSFIFMSDTQADPEIGNYASFGELLKLALEHESKTQLLVLGGDNVNNGNSSQEWETFWATAGENLDGIITASVAGNHDNNPFLAEQFDYPQTAPANTSEGFFYSFSEKNTYFLMLDSNIMGAGNASDIDWLSDQLSSKSATDADWRIVVLHHPFWPIADIPKDTQRAETMRGKFLPVMEENGVDLILCGHQHIYSRTAPMRSGNIEENGIIQIMTASGAKGSYSPGEKDYIEKAAEGPAYLIIEVDVGLMTITAYDKNGEPFDNVRIIRR